MSHPKKKTCPYCGHGKDHHEKDSGCTQVVPSSQRAVLDQCHCVRYPNKSGAWRR